MNNHQVMQMLLHYSKSSRWRQPPRVTRKPQLKRSPSATRCNHSCKCTWNHSQSHYDYESMMEISGRCLLRLKNMSSMSKCHNAPDTRSASDASVASIQWVFLREEHYRNFSKTFHRCNKKYAFYFLESTKIGTQTPLHLLNSCSNVLTTKCTTLCTCVSIFSMVKLAH